MLKKIDHNTMGRSDLGWLKSLFHFSFADYFNPHNMNFGVLRVINDDLVKAQTGFDTHPHRDMEIISYVVDGSLTHGDNMGNESTLMRGEVQYMSAGTGVSHSEYNLSDSLSRFLQIWILPDRKGHEPQYGDFRFDWSDRVNQWLHIVTGFSNAEALAPIRIHQDVNIYVTEIQEGHSLEFNVGEGRQAYLVQIEGTSDINGVELNTRDALEIVEEAVHINAKKQAHIMVIEMGQ